MIAKPMLSSKFLPLGLSSLLLLLLGLRSLPAEPASDILIRRNGQRTEQVTVTSDEHTKVVFSIPGPDGGTMVSQFPADHVVGIIYGDEPPSYTSARTYLERGSYQRALENFASAAGEKARPWLQVYGPFGMAECERHLGKFQDALRDYQRVLDTAPKSRLAPPSIEGMALASIGLGGDNFTKAWDMYEKLESGDYGVRWKLTGSLGKGFVRESEAPSFLAAGNSDLKDSRLTDALGLYQALIDTMGKATDLKDEAYKELLFNAKTRKGKVLMAQQRIDDAVQWFTTLIQGAREAKKGIAEAYNGRGDCLSAGKQYQRALWDYLRVATVYFYETPHHQYAVKRCVECFGLIGDKRKASEYAAMFKNYYPDTAGDLKIPEALAHGSIEEPATGKEVSASSKKIVLNADTPVQIGDKVIGNVKKGETCDILEEKGDWVRISLGNEVNGWIRKSLGQIAQSSGHTEGGADVEKPPQPPVPAGKGTVTILAENAKVLSSKNEVIAQVKQGESFSVLEEKKGWYRIEVNLGGQKSTGWIKAVEVKFSP